jgi:Kef-type K+ transport system membrane component KefB
MKLRPPFVPGILAGLVLLAAPGLLAAPALAADTGAGIGAHADPVAGVVVGLAIVLVAAMVGGDLAARIGQPAILGELTAGVLLGNLVLAGFNGADFIRTDASIDMLARLGVILLLFEVGLESTVAQMLGVGLSSFLVATLGVVAPMILGYLAGAWLLPDAGFFVHIFLGATLTATSVGITARVLQDLGRQKSDEARIILGAAVVDDVLGLIVLAVVGGLIAAADGGQALSYVAIGAILLKAIVFLAGALVLGAWLSPRLFHVASRLRTRGVLLGTGLAFCFVLSWLASAVGLAAIVGAFAAGLVLEDLHVSDFTGRGKRTLAETIHPITGFLAPVFFVLMGMRTDLRSFAEPGVLGLTAALTIAAILGKQVCGLGVIGRGLDRLSIGIGMIPRGEVGLIFAGIGMALHVGGRAMIDHTTYSAVVAMVILTTLATPPALKWSMNRRRRPARPGRAGV